MEFFAGIGGTRFGETCYTNDWYLKELGLGLKQPPVPGLDIYYDLAIEEARRDPANLRRQVHSRFWFYPLISQVHVFSEAGVVLLERFQLAAPVTGLVLELPDPVSFDGRQADLQGQHKTGEALAGGID